MNILQKLYSSISGGTRNLFYTFVPQNIFSSMNEFDDKKKNIRQFSKNILLTMLFVFIAYLPEFYEMMNYVYAAFKPGFTAILVMVASIIAAGLISIKTYASYSYFLKFASYVLLIAIGSSIPLLFNKSLNGNEDLAVVSLIAFVYFFSLFLYKVSYFSLIRHSQYIEVEDNDFSVSLGAIDFNEKPKKVSKKKLAVLILVNLFKVLIILSVALSLAIGMYLN